MPEQTTIHNSAGVRIFVDDELGNLVEISGTANEFTLKSEKDVEKFRFFGTRAYHRLVNGHDYSIDLNIAYSGGRKKGSEIIHYWFKDDTARTVIIQTSNEVGGWRYVGECFCTSLEASGKSEDAKPMMLKVKFEPNGDIDFERITG